jgi:hypothetical protein
MTDTNRSPEQEAEHARRRPRDRAESLPLPASRLGPSGPHQSPQHRPQDSELEWVESTPLLGEPLTIRQVALLLGCSVWTVRQRHLPQGLPHFRTGPAGKYVFYRNQVIRWLVRRQQKGGV